MPLKLIKTALIFWTMFLVGYILTIFVGTVFAQEIKMATEDTVRQIQPIKEKPTKKEALECTAGYCQLDGSLFVDPVIGSKRFELPETSTPTARSNKVVLWLQVEGTSQTVKVLFEDGTVKNLISNKTP